MGADYTYCEPILECVRTISLEGVLALKRGKWCVLVKISPIAKLKGRSNKLCL